MNSQDYWYLFCETGAPEMYLLYSQMRKAEELNVSDNQRFGASCNQLQ